MFKKPLCVRQLPLVADSAFPVIRQSKTDVAPFSLPDYIYTAALCLSIFVGVVSRATSQVYLILVFLIVMTAFAVSRFAWLLFVRCATSRFGQLGHATRLWSSLIINYVVVQKKSLLGTLNVRCRIIIGFQKGTIIFDNHPLSMSYQI